ncbi:ATP-grasp domain-containing protein [Clostridium sartagoforme]|uniref:ATP-grasp domain-containing protein n=1 Tax=Clostridium sartagoforme TaxID=84031 RepID=UPI0031D09C1A
MKIAIIGANEYQAKLILKCKENNIETHVFAWEDGAVGKVYCDFFYNISITEKERILKKCIEIGIDAVLSIGSDLAILTVNYIAAKLNLVGNSLFCTKVSTDKYEMRKVLSRNGVPCPKFNKVRASFDNSEINNMRTPLIAKPTDRSGSRGVNKINNINELDEAINKAQNESFCKEVIVEEFIEGKEYSMEFFSDNGNHTFLQITEKFTTGAPNFIEKAHLQPGRIKEEILSRAIEIAINGLNALEICNGASHVEIKVDRDEIFIIEIGARMGGDFIGSDLVRLSTGVDFTKVVLNKALGKVSNVKKKYNKYSFVYFIFTKKDLNNIIENYGHINKYIIEKFLPIDKVFTKVTDSSNRYGYILFQFDTYYEYLEVEGILLGEEL